MLPVSISREIDELFEWTYGRLLSNNFLTKTVSLKVRFEDRETITRSKTRFIPTDEKEILQEMIEELISIVNFEKRVKLLGISFGNLVDKSHRQLTLENFY